MRVAWFERRGVTMSVRKLLLVGIVAAVVAAAPTVSAAADPPGSPNLPNSIAGIGDSITRATDVCCWYGDHPDQSWSTGAGTWDGIASHY